MLAIEMTGWRHSGAVLLVSRLLWASKMKVMGNKYKMAMENLNWMEMERMKVISMVMAMVMT